MPFLAYADTQPALLLLFMVECLDPKPPVPDLPVICTLQQRLKARPNNHDNPASGQKQIFEALTSLLLPEVLAKVPLCVHVKICLQHMQQAQIHVLSSYCLQR